MFRRMLLIASSALLLHGALLNPAYLFWFSFIWLIPLFYSALTSENSPSFADGLLWGIVFFSFHIHPVTQLFFYQGNGVGRFFVPIFLIFYCALHSGLWFLLARITALLTGNTIAARALAWFFWSYCFIVWVPVGLLWISGQYIGYPLSFPLLPLARYPQFLWLLGTVGRNVLVASLVSFSMFCSLFFVTRKTAYVFLALLFLSLFLFGFFVPRREEKLPAFVKKIGYVRPPDSIVFEHSMDVAQEIYYRMRALLEKHPEVTYIVMPELSYRFALNEHPHILTMWNNNVLHDEVELFIGACRAEGRKIFNSLYWIKEGRVEQCYDKSRLMPLAEYVPSWCKRVPFIQTVFLDKNEFSETPCDGQVFRLGKNIVMEPYICAELFFGKKFLGREASDNAHLLSIINDSVLSNRFHNLMLLWNSFKALENNQFNLHVGYKGGFWLTQHGKIEPLRQLNT